MSLEVHASVQEKLYTLTFQQATLRTWVTDLEVRAAGSALLDHAMAGNARSVRVVVHGPADDPRRPGRFEHPGNLAIRSHFSVGDAGHQLIHPIEKSLLSPCEFVARLSSSPRPTA